MFPSSLEELIKWISFLLPGWLAVVIIGAVTDYGPSGEIAIVFSSFLISTVSYVVARAITRRLDTTPSLASQTARSPAVWSVFVVAALLGLLLGLAIQNNVLYSGLRLLPFGLGGPKVGDGRPRTSVLKDAKFNDLSYWIDGKVVERPEQNFYRVKLADGGPTYEGFVDRFETGEEDTDLYLNPACLVTQTGSMPVRGPGVLVYERSIVSIEIVDRIHSDCYKQTVLPPAAP